MEPIRRISGIKQQEQAERIARAVRAKIIRRICGVLCSVALLVAAGWFIFHARETAENLPGEVFASAGQEHIDLASPLPRPYNSNPPSSGGHYKDPAAWGIYDYEVNDRIAVHNLEHGGIWITYQSDVSPGVVNDLRAIVNEFKGAKLLMSPRSANDRDVAIVAWTRVFAFDVSGDQLTEQQKGDIRRFYRGMKNRGPEFVPDAMDGIDPKSVQP